MAIKGGIFIRAISEPEMKPQKVPAAMAAILETYETRVGPHLGAKVVARAWADPRFAALLFENANAAMAGLVRAYGSAAR